MRNELCRHEWTAIMGEADRAARTLEFDLSQGWKN